MTKIKSILLVDDDQINNFINKRVIKKLDIAEEVSIALNGEDAIQQIQVNCKENGQYPELIFLDINMPVMNGFEFLNKLKILGLNNDNEVKIIALTTSSNPKDLQRLKDYTINGFVNKPLTEKKIIDAIKGLEVANPMAF